MTFTEDFRTGIVGMGAGKSRFLPFASLRVGMTNLREE